MKKLYKLSAGSADTMETARDPHDLRAVAGDQRGDRQRHVP
jgi:hypothetical protein